MHSVQGRMQQLLKGIRKVKKGEGKIHLILMELVKLQLPMKDRC